MSIDARIASVRQRGNGVLLRLESYPTSDGTMSIRGVERLGIVNCTKPPHAGQKIWGNAGAVVIEAGAGGERKEYRREGLRLYERSGAE